MEGERAVTPGCSWALLGRVPAPEPAEHVPWMRRCLELARRAAEHGDAPVGSLVVRGGEVLGEGVESVVASVDPTAHAEVLAIRAAVRRAGTPDLRGCVLSTSVEPCLMCSYVIRETAIAEVVIGCPTSAPGGLGSPWPLLELEGVAGWGPLPAVLVGVLEEECRALLEARRRPGAGRDRARDAGRTGGRSGGAGPARGRPRQSS
jgi:tRNA(adenine34) deaminase